MKFKEIDDDEENGYFYRWRLELPEGRAFDLALWRVLFGYRVVGYYSDGYGPSVNWCCGADISLLVATHHSIMVMVESGCPIKDLRPFSKIKPWPLDREFVKYFNELANKYNTIAPGVSSPGGSTRH